MEKLEHVQGFDDEQVEELKRSKQIVGELLPVIKARFPDGRTAIVSGRHRTKAGWKRVEVIDVADELGYWKLVLQYNVGRKMVPIETAELFSNIANSLEATGTTNPEIVKYLLDCSPFSKEYSYTFIPDRYKSIEGRPAFGGRVYDPRNSAKPVTRAEKIDGTIVIPRETGNNQPVTVPLRNCPNCDHLLAVDPKSYELTLR